jgi:hypothetical protein
MSAFLPCKDGAIAMLTLASLQTVCGYRRRERL